MLLICILLGATLRHNGVNVNVVLERKIDYYIRAGMGVIGYVFG